MHLSGSFISSKVYSEKSRELVEDQFDRES